MNESGGHAYECVGERCGSPALACRSPEACARFDAAMREVSLSEGQAAVLDAIEDGLWHDEDEALVGYLRAGEWSEMISSVEGRGPLVRLSSARGAVRARASITWEGRVALANSRRVCR